MRYLSWGGLVAVLCLLTYLGFLEPYRQHLLYDVSVYYQRSLYFFEHGNLTDVTNEYLPGTTLFFITFSPVFFWSNSLEVFEKVFVAGNWLLLLVLGGLIFRKQGSIALLGFSLLLLCAGPIVLYRFEVLVILAMILAVLRFQAKDFWSSAVFLSLGMLVKLYPLLLLPYFLILTFRQQGIKQAAGYLGVFGITTAIVLLGYFLITQTGTKELMFSLDFHKDKPLGLESPLGAVTHLLYYLKTGQGAPIVARHNTWGVDDEYLLLPMIVLTYLWLIPVAGIYLWLLFSKVKTASFIFVITFLSTFFVFSKIFTPQYWLWILFLLPFLPKKKSYLNWGMISYAALATLITQFIYPLKYFDFLGYFYNQDKQFEYLFWIYLIEIFCMITTAVLAVIILVGNKDKN